MNEVGNYLRKVRKDKNISIRQLAKHTDVSAAYISQIENNFRKNPKRYVLKALCDGLGINYDQFLIETNQLSEDEVKSRRLFYEENKIEEIELEKVNENQSSFTKNQLDLYTLLTEDKEVYYKEKLLTNEEKLKINILLNTFLD